MILTSTDLEQIIKEEIEVILREVDMKKIGKGIGGGLKQAVSKLKKKPAQPAPPVEPPLPPDGFSQDPKTGEYQYRTTKAFDLAGWPHNVPSHEIEMAQDRLEYALAKAMGLSSVNALGPFDHSREVRYDRGAGKAKVQFIITAAGNRDAKSAEMAKRMGLEEGIIGPYDVAEVLKDLATSALRGKWKKAPGKSAYYVPYGDIDPRIDLPTMNMKKKEALVNINKRLKYYLDRGDIKGAAENLKKWLYGDVRQWGYTGQGQLANHPAAEEGSRAPMLPLAWSVAYEAYSALV